MEKYKRRFKEERKSIKEGRISEFDISSLVNPWGSGDIYEASKVANDFYLDFRYIEDMFEEMGGIKNAKNIDPVAMVYEVALSYADEVSKYFQEEDSIFDLVYVAGNYVGTTWDIQSRGDDETLEIELNNINPKDAKRLSKTTIAVLEDIVGQFGINVVWL